jgi:adenine-specific DNA-methyltransferase
MDFFAGSGTTAESVMRLNAEDGGRRQFILVQIPQAIDAKKQKEAHAFVTETLGKPEATIFEITAERIRRAGAKIRAQHPGVDTGFRVFALQDDPDALILHKPLHEATQADLAQLQQTIATPQPARSQRVLFNLLLAEGLPLSEKIEEIRQQALYRARDTLFILQSIELLELRELLQAAQAAGRPMAHVSVFAPWVQDDNFLLGISTLLEHQGLAADRLHLRG